MIELVCWVQSLKDGKSCEDCGEAYPYYVLQFDHDGDKKYNVSDMAWSGKSKALILAEISKCDLVCANCHAERTFRRRLAVGNI